MGYQEKQQTDQSTLWTDAGADRKAFRQIWEPLVHMNFRGNSCDPMALLPCFQRNSYGPMTLKSSSKVPPETGIGVHGWLSPVKYQSSLNFV